MTPRLTASIALLLAPLLAACGQSPIARTLDALGGEAALQNLDSLGIEATGTRWIIDESYAPGEEDEGGVAFSMQLRHDVAGDRLRIDYTRSRGAGEQQASQIIVGQTGVVEGQDAQFGPPGTTPLTSDRWAAMLREQRLLNPHLVLRDSLAEGTAIAEAGSEPLDGIEHHVLVAEDEVPPIRFYVDAETGLISKAVAVENDHLRRDVTLELTYGDWAPAAGGLAFPHRVLMTLDGRRIHEEIRTSITVNEPLDAALFELPADDLPAFDAELARWGAMNHQTYRMFAFMGFPRTGQHTNVEVEEIAPRIHHVRGSSHHSLVIEQEAGIVVAEAPLHELRSEAVIAWIRERFADKPITHVIPTHHHTDHSAGLRTYVAEGATVVAQEAAAGFYEEALQAPSTVLPDPLSRNPAPATFGTVRADEPFHVPDPAVPVAVYALENNHAGDMVMIHVPDAGVIFVSDIYSPNPAAESAGPGGQAVNDGIVANQLDVSLIAGGHGGVIGYADFQKLLGR